MRVRCLHCSAQVELDDRRVKGRKMAQIRCWMCAQSSVVDLLPPDVKSSTIVTDPVATQDRPFVASRLEQTDSARVATLDLPEGKSIAISVVAGSSQGLERGMTMPLVTIGRLRGGADFEIDDPMISRLHCAVEVKNDAVYLRDDNPIVKGGCLNDHRGVFCVRSGVQVAFTISLFCADQHNIGRQVEE